jgi:hypothetical protein
LLSHILGLDSYKQVQEIVVNLVYKLSQYESANQDINFYEFLAESIHSQLMNFHMEKTFRYQTLLLLIIIYQNWDGLQKVDSELFIDTFNLSKELGGISFVHFVNKIMSRIYKLIFDQELPRVTDMRRTSLQMGSEITGDWFLYAEYIEIRLYGFTRNPFLLPAFLTNMIFSLEFARQKIHTEKENFLNIKKGCNISFYFTIGPFVFKTSQTIQILTNILDAMKL